MPKSEGAGEDWCPEEAPSSKSHGSEEAQSLADRGEVLGEQVPENPTLALLRLSDISRGYSPSPPRQRPDPPRPGSAGGAVPGAQPSRAQRRAETRSGGYSERVTRARRAVFELQD